MITTTRSALLFTALLTLLVGCGTTPPASYYLLSPSAPAPGSADSATILQVGLGPVAFPAYLDRSKLIVVTGDNSLRMAEFHRWAEPLETNFVRVLAQDLAGHLPQAQIHKYPWRAGNTVQVEVRIEVLRFDTDNNDQARLGLSWQLTDRRNGTTRPLQSDAYVQPVTGPDYADRVQAMSRCVAAFSEDLARAIRTLEQMPPQDPGSG